MRPISVAAVAGVIVGPSVYLANRAREASRVAPELRSPLLLIPFAATNSALLRLLRVVAARPTKPLDGVMVGQQVVTSADLVDGGMALERPVRVFTYEPEGRPSGRATGVLLWVHGGGRVSGAPAADHRICSYLAKEAGVCVVSVDYRLAPEDPFPAGFNDVCAVLGWLHSDPSSLNVDPTRIAVGGASAGGGLAAEVCQWATDAKLPVAFQLLVYPMLDDRTVHPDPEGRGHFVWTAATNRFSWTAYLGRPAGEAEPRPYAVAARRPDLGGLPPAWIGVGERDLFYPEDVDYAARLEAANVPCTLDVVPGMYHAADVMPRPPKSMRAFWQRMAAALQSAVG